MERFSKNLPIERMHAASENGTIVGGAGAFPFELSVPGGVVPTAGVTVVGTFPTHRRRGVLRAMMRAQLDDVHARGEPLALLWASEDTIYGRFGYGMASQCADLKIPKEHSAFAKPLEREGSLRIVDAARGAEALPARLGCRAPANAGDAGADAKLVGASNPLRASGGWGGRPEAVRRPREGRPARGLRDLPAQAEVGRGDCRLGAPGRRGRRARRAPDGRDLALPPRHRLGRAHHRVTHAGRPPAVVAARHAEEHAAQDRRRSLGAAGRRRRRAVGAPLLVGRRCRLRRDRRVLPVERRSAGASRAAGRSERRPAHSFAWT